jgi:hypothetical protein
MTRTAFKPDAAKIVAQGLAEAITQGRHSLDWMTVCGGCRQWVAAIFYTTPDHVRLCADGADKINQGPKSIDENRRRAMEKHA